MKSRKVQVRGARDARPARPVHAVSARACGRRLNIQRLAGFGAIEERVADRPDIPARVAPLELGVRITRATIAFWEEVAADPPATA